MKKHGTKIYIIGIGYKPFDNKERAIVLSSEVILASKRLFEVFETYEEFGGVKDKVKVINNVDETINFIKELTESIHPEPAADKGSIVLLASGDPLFFGIGRRAVSEFGKDVVEILPDLSSVQMAFARIKEPWDNAFLMSLHGGPDPEKRRRLPFKMSDIPSLLQSHHKIGILTDRENNPVEIAKVLSGCRDFQRFSSAYVKIYVCERLGYADEKITEGTPEEIARMNFSSPNVLIVVRESEKKNSRTAAPFFGLSENEITHSKGLITKDEVRAVTLHKLMLPQKGIFWDIGAGSGSVSIEAARLSPDLQVFAVEKEPGQIQNIEENKLRFNAVNMRIIKGEAPDVLNELPAPDRVFIGGSGAYMPEILSFIKSKMGAGVIVVNAVTIDTLQKTIEILGHKGFVIDVTQVSVSRMKNIGQSNYLAPINPVFIIRGILSEY